MHVFGGGMAKPNDFVADRDSIEALRKASKEETGFGYHITWTDRNFRRFGTQKIPSAVTFTAEEDFILFLKKAAEVRQFQTDYELIQNQFQELISWAQTKPLKIVAHAGEWDGLLKVCAYLKIHGRPNCYLRELPVEVDTKFIERKRGVLNELLPIIAPNCVDSTSTNFETRFGFRQKQPLVRFRLLDTEIANSANLPFCDFAIPLDKAEQLQPPVINVINVIIVENEMTFLTLPTLPKTVALFGGGDAVSHLCRLSWLANSRLIYWGDLDTHGFESLSILRSRHPHAESIMMDNETFVQFKRFSTKASAFASRVELKLTDSERDVFNFLNNEGRLLEQERIPLKNSTLQLQSRFVSVPPLSPLQ
jgi:hypothetical protein